MTKRYFGSPVWVVLAVLVLLSSCLKDEEEVVLSSRCYISSFSLGSLKRIMHYQTADGKDTIYTTVFQGGNFPMTIDQQRLTIENLDSLPMGTKLETALATVGFQGVLFWRKADYKELEDTTWHTYGTKDSIDFTSPVHFLTAAADGSATRQYTVTVNVHQQRGDSTTWKRMDENTPWWTDPTADPAQHKCGQRIYTLTPKGAAKADGTVAEATELTSTALDGSGLRTELLDDEADKLPVENLSFVAYDGNRLLLVGGKEGEKAIIWGKTEEAGRWMYYTPNAADKKRLTVERNLTVLPYDGGLIALGGNLDRILYSRDHGITWSTHENGDMNIDPALQEAAKNGTTLSAAVDEDNFLWVLAGAELWRGRINRLGWARQDRE